MHNDVSIPPGVISRTHDTSRPPAASPKVTRTGREQQLRDQVTGLAPGQQQQVLFILATTARAAVESALSLLHAIGPVPPPAGDPAAGPGEQEPAAAAEAVARQLRAAGGEDPAVNGASASLSVGGVTFACRGAPAVGDPEPDGSGGLNVRVELGYTGQGSPLVLKASSLEWLDDLQSALIVARAQEALEVGVQAAAVRVLRGIAPDGAAEAADDGDADDRPLAYWACGDSGHDDETYAPGASAWCPRHGPTTVVSESGWMAAGAQS